MNDVFIALIGTTVGALLGGGIAWFINKETIKFSRKSEMANSIKEIFIDTWQELRSLETEKKDEARDTVINSFYQTDILIRKLFFYISKRKREKIERDYQEYKKEYIRDSTAIRHWKNIRGEHDPVPITYGYNKVENAKEKAMKHLEILINDFKHI